VALVVGMLLDQQVPMETAFAGARVSHVSGPQKVSHIAQQETGLKWVAQHGHTVVGTIQDLGVSASINPFERRTLGRGWLTIRPASGTCWYSAS
jgi:hypothetical protein